MPKCVKCNDFFPPNYTEVIDGSQPDPLDEGRYPQHCVFCKLGVDKVERETQQGSGKFVEYTKEECLRDYHEFLKKLKESKNVKDIMNKGQQFS
jgi:hypothetical protein